MVFGIYLLHYSASAMQLGSFLKWQLGVRLAIYKSAAQLRVLLTPHRHPLAALAGAEAKRTPERTN